MSIKACQCRECQLLTVIALDLASVGLYAEAEIVAQSITWYELSEDTSEGYTSVWREPPKDDLRVN